MNIYVKFKWLYVVEFRVNYGGIGVHRQSKKDREFCQKFTQTTSS